MKKPKPHGSMEGPGGLKAFAKQLVSQYALGLDAARFSVVSFATDATTRVPWSTNDVDINAGIDQMEANGKTSISGGFEAAGQLFANTRPEATKVVLLLSDGEQSDELAADGKTALQTVVDAAGLVKGSGVTVFAWGFGEKVALTTLTHIATDPSKAILAQNMSELNSYLGQLEAAICTESLMMGPPPSPSRSPPACAYTFTSTASLKTAVQAFDANPTAATATYGTIADWCVSAITDMSYLFYELQNINADISSWDTSRVTDMSRMFRVRSHAYPDPIPSLQSRPLRRCRLRRPHTPRPVASPGPHLTRARYV